MGATKQPKGRGSGRQRRQAPRRVQWRQGQPAPQGASPPQGAGSLCPAPPKKKKSIAAGKLPEPLALCHPICYTEHSGIRRDAVYTYRGKDVLTNDYRNLHAVPPIPGLHRSLLYTRSLGGAEYPGSPRHHRLPGRRLPIPLRPRGGAGRAAILRRRTERVYSQLLHSGQGT